jgi:hypothetical protein
MRSVLGARRPAAVGLAMIAVAVAGCGTGASPGTSSAGAASSPVVASSTSPSPDPSPSPSPDPTPPVPTAIDGELVLRADAVPDVTAGRVPGVSIYADGAVLLRGGDHGLVAKLTPEALDALWSEVLADPAIRGDDIGPPPDWAAGFVSYIVQVRDGDRLVRRGVTNAYPADRAAEAAAVMELVDRLQGLAAWLPDDAWLVAPGDATPWMPATYLLKVIDWGYVPDMPLPVDVADVAWPLAEAPTEIGQPFELGYPPDDPGAPRGSRCGVIDLATALAVQEALVPVAEALEDRIPVRERSMADLAWAEAGSFLTISLAAQLPDDPADCSADISWP